MNGNPGFAALLISCLMLCISAWTFLPLDIWQWLKKMLPVVTDKQDILRLPFGMVTSLAVFLKRVHNDISGSKRYFHFHEDYQLSFKFSSSSMTKNYSFWALKPESKTPQIYSSFFSFDSILKMKGKVRFSSILQVT